MANIIFVFFFSFFVSFFPGMVDVSRVVPLYFC